MRNLQQVLRELASCLRLQGTSFRGNSCYMFQVSRNCTLTLTIHFLSYQLKHTNNQLFTIHYSHLTSHLSPFTSHYSPLINHLIGATAAGKGFRLGFKRKPHPQNITHSFAQGFIAFKMRVGVYVGMHFHINIKFGKQIA